MREGIRERHESDPAPDFQSVTVHATVVGGCRAVVSVQLRCSATQARSPGQPYALEGRKVIVYVAAAECITIYVPLLAGESAS